ncbi:hypothetical protein HUU40_00230 [candidate division KSB1 bacterium]|nr:hypothetical protein [candidate division KSB1 bacterium]
MKQMFAQAYDNRTDRKAAVLNTARPFVAVKPKGYLNRVIGHYETMKAAEAAAKRFNDQIANHPDFDF